MIYRKSSNMATEGGDISMEIDWESTKGDRDGDATEKRRIAVYILFFFNNKKFNDT